MGIVGFVGQIELDGLRLFGLPEGAGRALCLPLGASGNALHGAGDDLRLLSLAAGATANIDVTVPRARRSDFADASLDSSSIAFVDCHEWSNISVSVTARNVSASTVDPAAAALSVQVTKRRAP